MEIRDQIIDVFNSVFEDQLAQSAPVMADDSVLLESGLDSLAFAIIVARLDEVLGYDPFAASDTPYYPRTFGDFVKFYTQHPP